MNWNKDICQSINRSAKVAYKELEEEKPTRPLDFPSPIVHRATIISVQAYDPTKSEYTRMKNVLVRSRRGTIGRGALSRDYINIRAHEQSTSDGDHEIGYCIRQKIASATYGGVYKGVVMKRRKLHSGEDTLVFSGLQEKRSKASSLQSIIEDAIIEQIVESFDDSCLVSPNCASDEVWEATGEYVAIKVSHL